jgi:hypothetical protein
VVEAYATGSVVGLDSTGGAVGSGRGHITDTFATGPVSGRDYVGGLVGDLSSNQLVASSYATGTVRGRAFVGGLVGGLSSGLSVVDNCFATGRVEGDTATDTVARLSGTALTFTASYFDAASTCINAGGACDAFGTPVDLTAQPNYFFAPTQPPLAMWAFGTVWSARAADYPLLLRAR